MITSITKFAADHGLTTVALKEQIAKHRVKHVKLSLAGYPLYSESALVEACEELGEQDRKMFVTLTHDDYKRLARLAHGRGKHVGSYAGYLLSEIVRRLYEKRYAD